MLVVWEKKGKEKQHQMIKSTVVAHSRIQKHQIPKGLTNITQWSLSQMSQQ